MERRPAIETQDARQQGGERGADPGATATFLERVTRYQDEVGRQRFAGEDPVVRPESTSPDDVAAAVVAAERVGGLFQFDGRVISPAEDVAAGELDAALRALANWDVRSARWRLEVAVRFAHLPEQQQRISLAQALAQTVRDVLYEPPGRPRVKPETPVVSLIPNLDRLPREEAAFYAAEAKRLGTLWRQAGRDDQLWTGWALARVRIVLRDGEPDAALAWLLRIYQRNRLLFSGDEYLRELARRAEAVFRLLLPVTDGDEEDKLRQLADAASAHDLLLAIVASLSQAWQVDAMQVSNRFALVLYQRPEPETEPSRE